MFVNKEITFSIKNDLIPNVLFKHEFKKYIYLNKYEDDTVKKCIILSIQLMTKNSTNFSRIRIPFTNWCKVKTN